VCGSLFPLLQANLPFKDSRDRADVSIRQGSARKRYDHEEAKVELPELGMRRGNSPFDVRRDPEHFRNGV